MSKLLLASSRNFDKITFTHYNCALKVRTDKILQFKKINIMTLYHLTGHVYLNLNHSNSDLLLECAKLQLFKIQNYCNNFYFK